ncbi:MAG: hypothetical protein U5Q16_12020 [Gammaproteobacteria bacterium]|nr:hypothetical protein [Gammaproteobacteria bacterium]
MDAQHDAAALNVVNAAGGDTAQAVNVLEQPASAAALAAGFDLGQTNRIVQLDQERAAAGRFATAGPQSYRHSTRSGSASESASAIDHMAHIDRHVTSHTTTTTFSAEVTPRRVGLFDDPVVLDVPTITLDQFFITPPDVDVEFSVLETLLGTRFDLPGLNDFDLDFTRKSLTGIELDLGAVTLEGSDVVLTGPSLVLPDLEFDFCFLNFRSCSGPLSSFTTVTLPGGRVELGDFRFAGANPLGDVGIDLGYAIAGDGTLSVDAGQVAFSGTIPLDLGLVEHAFDILVPDIGIVDQLTAEFELPGFELPVDETLELPVPEGFNRRIDNEACTYGENGLDCTPLDVTTTIVDSRTHTTTEVHQRTTVSSETFVEFDVLRKRGPLEVRAGQARMTVLRSGSAEEQRYNVVIVNDGAQHGLAALNGVNAAAAIVGNASNVTASPRPTIPGGPARTARLGQSNRITQIGGL